MEEMTFESALARLEAVVREIESGKAPLDKTLSLFEEGKALVEYCEKALTDAEQRVTKVTPTEERL
ncbi:MAG: exodeoxyribonuclease VII small subunit [Clostridia bacterium]|nr:exodeoxyribonuclease VII small subunit [Clostridia bacterium]